VIWVALLAIAGVFRAATETTFFQDLWARSRLHADPNHLVTLVETAPSQWPISRLERILGEEEARRLVGEVFCAWLDERWPSTAEKCRAPFRSSDKNHVTILSSDSVLFCNRIGRRRGPRLSLPAFDERDASHGAGLNDLFFWMAKQARTFPLSWSPAVRATGGGSCLIIHDRSVDPSKLFSGS